MMGNSVTGELGQTGTLAKVTAIGEDRLVHFDRRDGKTGSFRANGEEYSVGNILLMTEEAGENRVTITVVPSDTWPEELWVGIVKLKLTDTTVVDLGGRLRTVPTTTTPHYEKGFTVQCGETRGVVRVLSESPIRYLDFSEVDDSTIDRFRTADASDLNFDDFGGLPDVVARARELIEVPLRFGKALSTIGARAMKGVLFTGQPGTGKTMLARIIASQAEASFYEISGPEIFSKWYGQSEEVLRRIFGAAAKDDKAIVFFDEIDSVAAQRGDESHEASKRVVAQLLTLMDGFSSSEGTVVIAATNRPQDLDVALRRPGRFDWEIEFPYPNEGDRKDILVKTARKIRTCGPLPHDTIAAKTGGWSAAQIAQIWTEAALLAVADQRDVIRDEDFVGGFERVSLYRRQATQLAARQNDR